VVGGFYEKNKHTRNVVLIEKAKGYREGETQKKSKKKRTEYFFNGGRQWDGLKHDV